MEERYGASRKRVKRAVLPAHHRVRADVHQHRRRALEAALTPRQALELAISNDQHNISNYLMLAELLVEAEHYQAAEGLLNRALIICGMT